jgi:hypothetical protein
MAEPIYADELATLYQGDVLEVLRGLPAGSVDAVVTDPPAGISFMGRDWDTFPTRRRPAGHAFADGRARPAITQGQEHRAHRAGGRDAFVAWLTQVMVELHRLLSPGGHVLLWAIPRTSHWTATAIEDAGFEVRDVVHHLFAQGFPKSLNVGRAIDSKVCQVPGRHYWSEAKLPKGDRARAGDHVCALSPEGDGHRGEGTGLKPAAEHWILARRPLAEATVAANVLAHGAGAIDIDACRIAHAEPPMPPTTRRTGKFAGAVYAGDEYSLRMADANRGPARAGRWPANLVLSHSEGCRPMGTRMVRNPGGGIAGGQPSITGTYEGGERPRSAWQAYGDADGLETVEVWECVEDCPVAELDRQSGVREAGHHPVRRTGLGFAGHGSGTDNGNGSRDEPGGASRFFYVAKASAADRNAGLVGDRNRHPTVKPVELMRWLCRMVTPPGGVVLDCFAGSGSTLVAAKLEGLHSIGIERDLESVRTGARRLQWATHQLVLLDGPELTEAGEWSAVEAAEGGER